MSIEKKKHPAIKSKLHPRSKHRERYDLKQLVESCPDLRPHVGLNKYGDESIDFFDPEAVKMLNKALLLHFYEIKEWDIPAGYLCPPVPGRADYIHYMADILSGEEEENIPRGEKVRCLDIGVGANCVYPIIGSQEYGWSYVGTDIDKRAIENAAQIISQNTRLQGRVELRLQRDSNQIFGGIIQEGEYFDLVVCNPPFHTSAKEAQAATSRKLKNLKREEAPKAVLNFGGKNNELWCVGGEERFIQNMIRQSKEFAGSCNWFSTLVARHSHLKGIYKALEKVDAAQFGTIDMGQGNKISRIVVWSFND